MLKMKFSNPSYSIEKDGKTTVCVYYCEIYETHTQESLHSFVAIGKSTCKEKDTFNTKIGERFAENHAKQYAYEKALEFVNLDEDEINTLVTSINNVIDDITFYDRMKHLLNAENKHLHKLLKMY